MCIKCAKSIASNSKTDVMCVTYDAYGRCYECYLMLLLACICPVRCVSEWFYNIPGRCYVSYIGNCYDCQV